MCVGVRDVGENGGRPESQQRLSRLPPPPIRPDQPLPLPTPGRHRVRAPRRQPAARLSVSLRVRNAGRRGRECVWEVAVLATNTPPPLTLPPSHPPHTDLCRGRRPRRHRPHPRRHCAGHLLCPRRARALRGAAPRPAVRPRVPPQRAAPAPPGAEGGAAPAPGCGRAAGTRVQCAPRAAGAAAAAAGRPPSRAGGEAAVPAGGAGGGQQAGGRLEGD